MQRLRISETKTLPQKDIARICLPGDPSGEWKISRWNKGKELNLITTDFCDRYIILNECTLTELGVKYLPTYKIKLL